MRSKHAVDFMCLIHKRFPDCRCRSQVLGSDEETRCCETNTSVRAPKTTSNRERKLSPGFAALSYATAYLAIGLARHRLFSWKDLDISVLCIFMIDESNTCPFV